MKIAVDVMGGDFGPAEIINGAFLAAKKFSIEPVFVGDEGAVLEEVKKIPHAKSIEYSVVHSDVSVAMEDKPSYVLRHKKDSSIHKGLTLVRDGEASAFFSVGNTGAVMAVAMAVLKRIDGVERPAIGAILPGSSGRSIMLDVGANVECSANHLLQFAVMGSAYYSALFGKELPRVGILNIGEEDIKGNDTTRKTLSLIRSISPNNIFDFHGNVEGKEVFKSVVDVIVTDGFSGNIALKVSESAGLFLRQLIKEELSGSISSKLGAVFSASALRRIKKRADYSEYGGALLLGVNGICTLGHGSSNSVAIMNALKISRDLIDNQLNRSVEDKIRESFEFLKLSEEYDNIPSF